MFLRHFRMVCIDEGQGTLFAACAQTFPTRGYTAKVLSRYLHTFASPQWIHVPIKKTRERGKMEGREAKFWNVSKGKEGIIVPTFFMSAKRKIGIFGLYKLNNLLSVIRLWVADIFLSLWQRKFFTGICAVSEKLPPQLFPGIHMDGGNNKSMAWASLPTPCPQQFTSVTALPGRLSHMPHGLLFRG